MAINAKMDVICPNCATKIDLKRLNYVTTVQIGLTFISERPIDWDDVSNYMHQRDHAPIPTTITHINRREEMVIVP